MADLRWPRVEPPGCQGGANVLIWRSFHPA